MIVKGGINVDADGRVRTTFGHNPSSLRLCSFDPNLQNIPRGGSEIAKWVKELYVAPRGHLFWARDYSGIEAVLVGYFAGARNYTRLAKIDVHSFYTAYALNSLDGRVGANDLPDVNWPDSRLANRLGEIKAEFKADRNGLYKHLVHGANFLQSPKGAQRKIFKETGKVYDIKVIGRVMGVYFELFPEIRTWHKDLCDRVDGTKRRSSEGSEDVDPWTLGVCTVTNPFGYVHRFYNVLDWEKIDGKWYSSYGDDAKRLVSFLPQSTAAAIIKRSAKDLWYNYPWVGETIRLLIHDEILGESIESEVGICLEAARIAMEAPIKECPLDPTWEMGEYLVIGTEPKQGPSWASMH